MTADEIAVLIILSTVCACLLMLIYGIFVKK